MTPNKPTTLRESLLQEFDEKFGKPQFDEDGELFLECSIGRSAGCDDCFTNQKERAEHREFLEKVLTSHSTELVSKIEGIVREETPNHFTREYRDTDSMRDRICKRCRELLQYELCLTKTKKLDENNGEGGLEITEKIE